MIRYRHLAARKNGKEYEEETSRRTRQEEDIRSDQLERSLAPKTGKWGATRYEMKGKKKKEQAEEDATGIENAKNRRWKK